MFSFHLAKDSAPEAVSSSSNGSSFPPCVKGFPKPFKDSALLILTSATATSLPRQSQSSMSSNASANTAFAFGKASANTAFAFGNPSLSCTKKLFSCQPVQPAAEQKSPMHLRDEISEANQGIAPASLEQMPRRKSSAEEKGGEEEMEDEGKEPESAVEGAGLLAMADDSTEKSDNTEPHCRRKADEPSTQIDFLAPGPTALPSVHLPPTAALPSEQEVEEDTSAFKDEPLPVCEALAAIAQPNKKMPLSQPPVEAKASETNVSHVPRATIAKAVVKSLVPSSSSTLKGKMLPASAPTKKTSAGPPKRPFSGSRAASSSKEETRPFKVQEARCQSTSASISAGNSTPTTERKRPHEISRKSGQESRDMASGKAVTVEGYSLNPKALRVGGYNMDELDNGHADEERVCNKRQALVADGLTETERNEKISQLIDAMRKNKGSFDDICIESKSVSEHADIISLRVSESSAEIAFAAGAQARSFLEAQHLVFEAALKQFECDSDRDRHLQDALKIVD